MASALRGVLTLQLIEIHFVCDQRPSEVEGSLKKRSHIGLRQIALRQIAFRRWESALAIRSSGELNLERFHSKMTHASSMSLG